MNKLLLFGALAEVGNMVLVSVSRARAAGGQFKLHKEVTLIKVCRLHNIRLTVEWVSRDANSIANTLSRVDDPDNLNFRPTVF